MPLEVFLALAFLALIFLFLPGHPCCIRAYASGETVDFDLRRLVPARLRRLMFSTSEFFFAAIARLSQVERSENHAYSAV